MTRKDFIRLALFGFLGFVLAQNGIDIITSTGAFLVIIANVIGITVNETQ